MSASQVSPLLALLNRLSTSKEMADALFAMANAADASDPAEAEVMRSIARAHRVKALELEAQLATLNEDPDRLASDRY